MELSTITKQTMSSRDVAELTGKRHSDVLKDIDKMSNDLEKGNIPFVAKSTTYSVPYQSRGYREMLMDKETTMCLVSSYSHVLRMKVIQRWQELEEQQPKLPDFTNPAEAARAWASEYEAKVAEIAAHNETKLELEDKTIQLDESKEWFSIKRVAKHNDMNWRELSWRKLKATGLPTKHIFDANYGKVNAYHIDAWEAIYPELELPF